MNPFANIAISLIPELPVLLAAVRSLFQRSNGALTSDQIAAAVKQYLDSSDAAFDSALAKLNSASQITLGSGTSSTVTRVP